MSTARLVTAPRTGHLELLPDSRIERIIVVDGGEAFPESILYRERRLAFIKICAMPLDNLELDRMRTEPIPDPRDLNRILRNGIWHNGGVIPLAGVRIPDLSVRETIRQSIHRIVQYSGLYPTLQFLVSREWDPAYPMGTKGGPHFDCRSCGQTFFVPKSRLGFHCPVCRHEHMLSDYLQIDQFGGDEWVRGETAQALRNVLEILTLLHCIRVLQGQPETLGKTLFLRDGPLLLRAGLYRLVDDIRAFISHMRAQGIQLQLVGIEKTGDMIAYIDEAKRFLPDPGDFCLPTYRFIAEEIHGRTFHPEAYRNRALFGAKIYARVGPRHLLALNNPVCDFTRDPTPNDLLGFQPILSALSGLRSDQYENALIPIVLANRYASISRRFSGSILDTFASRILS